MNALDPLVSASNALTARWSDKTFQNQSNHLISGAALWPLWAILAASASDPARTELAEAITIDPHTGFDQARAFLALTQSSPAIKLAFATWVKDKLLIHPDWLSQLPNQAFARLAGDDQDQARLDAWVQAQSDGLIPSMPVAVDAETLMVLATALLVQTKWLEPFHFVPAKFNQPIKSGSWTGRKYDALLSTTTALSRLRLDSQGGLTLLEVPGSDDISVYLALGPAESSPASVVSSAILALSNWESLPDGSSLEVGAKACGLNVTKVPSESPRPSLRIETIPFQCAATHNLLDQKALFGLVTASDDQQGHFASISHAPLYVSAAAQSVMAEFSAIGFRAAAVTASSMSLARGLPRRDYQSLRIDLNFNRPFAFLAAHKLSGLVLVAGWIENP